MPDHITNDLFPGRAENNYFPIEPENGDLNILCRREIIKHAHEKKEVRR